MSRERTTGRRVRRVAIAALAAGLYAIVLAAGSVEHHDLACHLKSRTHCTTCVFVSIPGDEPGTGDAMAPLPIVALIGPDAPTHALAGTRPLQSNRAPPAC